MLRWINLPLSTLAIILVVVIANLGNNIVSPVLHSIRDYFGSTAAEAGLLVSAFGFGRLVMDLPAGFLTERFSVTRMFAGGILLSGIASALAIFSPSLEHLVAFRFAMGAGSSTMTTVAMIMLVNSTRPNERGKILGFYTSAMLFGQALSPMIGGYLAALFDWRAVFVFCALTPFISFPLNLVVTRRAPKKLESASAHGRSGTGHRGSTGTAAAWGRHAATNWIALVTVFLSTFVVFFNRHGMQNSVLPLYAGSVLGMDPAGIGNVLSSRAIFTMVLMVPFGTLGDRIGRKQLLIPGMLIAVAGNLFLLTGDSVLTFTVSTFLVSAGILANNMLSTLIAELVPERLMGRSVGLYRFVGDLGVVTGPFLLGLLVDHFSFTMAALVPAGMILVGVAAVVFLVPWRTGAARMGRAER